MLASPFASAYPEWRETRDEIELRGWRTPRSVVALSQTIADAAPSKASADASLSPTPPEGGKLVRLPVADRGVSLAAVETSPASEPARVLSMREWKKKMPNQSNDDPRKERPRPTTDKEKQARLNETVSLGTREMLLSIMAMLGDESVSDDQLRRALIILEGLEPDENQGS